MGAVKARLLSIRDVEGELKVAGVVIERI